MTPECRDQKQSAMTERVKKRRQGRPADEGVGREKVIATARRLLEELPPAKISLSLIAREANVDPALIRYYFKDRTNLLLIVVQDMLARPAGDVRTVGAGFSGDARKTFADRIKGLHRFIRSAKHMQRLMIDELAEAKSAEVRKSHREINLRAIEAYKKFMDSDDGKELRQVDPLFLYLTTVGIFDFFVSAQSLVRAVTPPDTNLEALSEDFEKFVLDLLLNGLRRR